MTAAIDRPLPDDHPEVRDYARAAGFRRLCAELGENPAVIAHRYALSLDIDTLVLGVKNREELAECVAAAEAGPLPAELIARIDASVAPAAELSSPPVATGRRGSYPDRTGVPAASAASPRRATPKQRERER